MSVDRIVDRHLRSHTSLSLLLGMAGTTGLEPATSAVTGQHSNQLNYVPIAFAMRQVRLRGRCSLARHRT
jgi:hypothetical protein